MTNQDVPNATQRKNPTEILLSKQLRLFGYWLRRPPERTSKKYTLCTTNQGKNRKGRPRVTNVKLMQKEKVDHVLQM